MVSHSEHDLRSRWVSHIYDIYISLPWGISRLILLIWWGFPRILTQVNKEAWKPPNEATHNSGPDGLRDLRLQLWSGKLNSAKFPLHNEMDTPAVPSTYNRNAFRSVATAGRGNPKGTIRAESMVATVSHFNPLQITGPLHIPGLVDVFEYVFPCRNN